MATQNSYVIIGNGIAGATAAEVLRAENSAVEILVVTDEPTPVFYRPALKDYLGGKIGEEKIWARPISFYSDRRINFVTDRVMEIQPGAHTLRLASGQSMAYSRLLLAHGARATTLTCPGIHLEGVTTLRTVADYQRVLTRLNMTKRIVVVGSGTLALESIETLRHRGYEVTHLLRRRTLWSEVLDPVASDLVLQQERREGVDVRVEQEIAEIVGRQGQVTGVITTTGQHISCEVVLLGIGIEPITDFVKSAGIACGRGVKVDGAMRTNVADIYAAGDLIEATDPITNKARVIGQWYPSIQQARAAAYSMLDLLDTEHEFRFGNFYNATFLYGLDFASVGISTIPKGQKDYQELVADPKPRQYQKVIVKQGIPVGMLALGDRRSVLTYKRAIDHQVNLSPVLSRLFAPDFDLGAWMDTQGVPPPILGVKREGVVAVEKVAYAMKAAKALATTVPPGTLPEARLVPIADVKLSVMSSPLHEVYLSQTQIISIGRQEGSSLVIDHNTVSRRHAEISYANEQYVLRDLGSKNGTALNDQRVPSNSLSVLTPGDRIRFGKVEFRFETQLVEATVSVLLNKQQNTAFFRALARQETPPPAANNTANHKGTMAAQPVAGVAQNQPFLSPDGSLFFPGAMVPLPPERVALLREGPALVVLRNGQPVMFSLSMQKPVSLGRDPHNDIVLAEMSVSRKHAQIFPEPDGLYIRNLQSGNGVQVNHHKITTAYRLTHEAHIKLGNVSAYFMNYQMEPSPTTRKASSASSAIAIQARGEEAMPPTAVAVASSTGTLRCHNCNMELLSQARFCPRCGSAQ